MSEKQKLLIVDDSELNRDILKEILGSSYDYLEAENGTQAIQILEVHPEIDLMRYMDDKRAKEDKVFDQPKLMKTPVVRNGKQATVGYCPEIWETWE